MTSAADTLPMSLNAAGAVNVRSNNFIRLTDIYSRRLHHEVRRSNARTSCGSFRSVVSLTPVNSYFKALNWSFGFHKGGGGCPMLARCLAMTPA